MPLKRFTKNDSGFICSHCGADVPPLGSSSRDHCNVCLYSLHADINPGDRACGCGGMLVPVSAEPHPRKGFVINYRCAVCGESRRCRSAPDDPSGLLIRLTAAGK